MRMPFQFVAATTHRGRPTRLADGLGLESTLVRGQANLRPWNRPDPPKSKSKTRAKTRSIPLGSPLPCLAGTALGYMETTIHVIPTPGNKISYANPQVVSAMGVTRNPRGADFWTGGATGGNFA